MKKVIILFLIILLVISVVCTYKDNANLKLGKYVTSDGHSWVILDKNHKFIFDRELATNYLPIGNFEIKDNQLILVVSDDEKYIFTIENRKLIFKEGKLAENFITPGTVFELNKD
jgi:hypothetical protein